MPHFTRSRDHNLWFAHIVDPDGALLVALQGLDAGQAVVLRIGNEDGLWRRFERGKDGTRPMALRSADDRSKAIWSAIPVDGSLVEIILVRIVPIDASPPDRLRKRGRTPPKSADLAFTPAASRLNGDVLCIGIDIAWWGGQKGKKHTQSECLAMAARLNGEWGELQIVRIDLSKRANPAADPFTANADIEACLLADGLRESLSPFATTPYIVIAGDVPMLAMDRPELGKPRKSNEERKRDPNDNHGDAAAFRQCDSKWMECKAASPSGWKTVEVLPGAPMVPRVVKLVEKLQALGFVLYRHPFETHPTRTLLECFPNEVLWSAGVLGHADMLTAASIRAYKRIGKGNVRLPSDVFLALCRHTLFPAMQVAQLAPAICERWYEAFVEQLRIDKIVTDNPAEGRSGKAFDDCVDSVLALTAAVAFVDGVAHVHQGSNPNIIGPGLARALSQGNTIVQPTKHVMD